MTAIAKIKTKEIKNREMKLRRLRPGKFNIISSELRKLFVTDTDHEQD
jgi:hypothetical protein